MLESQRLELEYGQTRQQMNQLSADIENRAADDPDMETKLTERRAFWDKLIDIDTRKMAAAEKEDAEAQVASQRDANTEGWDPELREQQQLLSKVSLLDVLEAANKGEHPSATSAFGEYRSHILPYEHDDVPGTFPLELLLPREGRAEMGPDELRAVTTVGANANVNQASVAARIFAQGDAAYLGGRFTPAAGGTAVFPVIGSTVLGVSIADGTDEAISAGTITLKRLNPLRIQRSYEWYEREFMEGTGFEAALAADLSGALMAGLDNITSDAVITDLGSITSATALATLGTYIGGFAAGVDAKAARTVDEVRQLVGTSTYAQAYGTNVANIVTAYQLLPTARFRASANIAAVASQKQNAILFRTGVGPSRLVVPVWRRASLLRDPYTAAAGGIMRLWGTMYANAGLLDTATHAGINYQVAS